MKISSDREVVSCRLLESFPEPFQFYLPLAETCCYGLGNGKILVQKIESEFFSLVTYEAIFTAATQIQVAFGRKARASLYFILENDVTVQQRRFPPLALKEQSYLLVSWPADATLRVNLAQGRSVIFRVDYAKSALR